MRPAERARHVDRDGDCDPPDDGHLENPDLRPREHRRADAAAAEKHDHKGSKKLPGKPFRMRFHE
jgi:hypothetical protein